MNEWTHCLTRFTVTPNKLPSNFWTLWQCVVKDLPLESDLLEATYRSCSSNHPSPAQQWEKWVNQCIPLLLQAFLAFLFQRKILQVNTFMLKYRLCLYTSNFDPSSPAKIFPLLEVWKCHNHPITTRAMTKILKIAQQKDERSWMNSSQNPQNWAVAVSITSGHS